MIFVTFCHLEVRVTILKRSVKRRGWGILYREKIRIGFVLIVHFFEGD